MPHVLPTADELAAMPWHKRDKALANARRVLAEYNLAFEPFQRTRMSDSQRKRRAEQRRRQAQKWGEQVRKEARRLERESNRRAGVER